MRIGTRITVATALSVTLTLAVYALFEVRARDAARRGAIESEARATAMAMRAALEGLGKNATDFDPQELSRELARELGRTTAWKVVIVPSDPPGTAPPLALTPQQGRRLRALGGSPQLALIEHEPATAMAMLRSLTAMIRATNERLADVLSLDVPGRVAK